MNSNTAIKWKPECIKAPFHEGAADHSELSDSNINNLSNCDINDWF
jgi:hypothetical protein